MKLIDMITSNTKDFIEFIYDDNYYIYRKVPKESYKNWYASSLMSYNWDGISDDTYIVPKLKIHLKNLLRIEKLKTILEE